MAVGDCPEGGHHRDVYAASGVGLMDEQPYTLPESHLVVLVNGVWR